MAPTTPFDAQRRLEAQRRYDQLTARISALDTDIGRATDSEHKFTMQQSRTELARERDTAVAELSALGWGVDGGDNSEIIGKLTELLAALNSQQPERAHKILGEIVTIDARMQAAEGEIKDHKGRLTAIERHIHPPLAVNALRVVAALVVLLGIAIAGLQYPVFAIYPFLGITIEGALIILAAVILLYANAIQERRL